MSDRHAEGIEKAAEASYVDASGLTNWEKFTEKYPDAANWHRRRTETAVAAYLNHVNPVVEDIGGLLALPNGTLIKGHDGRERFLAGRDRAGYGWWSCADAAHHLDEHDINLPARVLHMGGSEW